MTQDNIKLFDIKDLFSYNMRPKASSRKNARGEVIYSYVCTTKERSRSKMCAAKNVNGNTLDAAVINVIKDLSKNGDELAKQLENVKKRLISENTSYGDTITSINAKIATEEKEISSLTLALAKAEGSVAEKYVLARIEESHEKIELLKAQLKQLESIITQNKMCDIDFDLIKQILSSFAQNVDAYSIEEKKSRYKDFRPQNCLGRAKFTYYLFNNDEELDLSLPFNVTNSATADETLCEDSKNNMPI